MSDNDLQPESEQEKEIRIVSETVHQFYQELDFPTVDGFDPETASPEEIDAFKERIDNAQNIVEELEGMRYPLNSTFTEGELEDMKYAQLQRIAKGNDINARQSKAVLVKAMTDMNKSIPVLAMRKHQENGQSKIWARIGWARSVANYLHPRQTRE